MKPLLEVAEISISYLPIKSSKPKITSALDVFVEIIEYLHLKLKRLIMKRATIFIIFFIIILSIRVHSQSLSNSQIAIEQINLNVKEIETKGYEIYKIQLGGYSNIQMNINDYELYSFPYNDTIFVKAISIVNERSMDYKVSNLEITKVVKSLKVNTILKREIVSNMGSLISRNEKNRFVDVWNNYFIVKKNEDYDPLNKITNFYISLDVTPRIVQAPVEYLRNNSLKNSNLKTLILILYNRLK